jgi:hypothetical protein
MFRDNWILGYNKVQLKENTVVFFRKRTIPTERSPLADEVSVNFCG